MKTVVQTILCLILLTAVAATAQQKREPLKGTFLFDEYTEGKALIKGGFYTRTRFNYDCVNQELHFRERDQDMIMDNTSNIDTIYIGSRRFIPYETRFLEYIPTAKGVLLVDWKAKIHNIGRKGAMGIVSQSGGIEKVDVQEMQHKGLDFTGNDIYQVKYHNTYLIDMNGQPKKFNNLKSFVKLFPKEQQAEVEAIAKKQHTGFDDPEQVAALIADSPLPVSK